MKQLAFDAVETAQEFGFKPSVYRELSVDSGSLHRGSDVLPILSLLSHRRDERWLTCVNTPVLARDVAKAADIKPSRLLRVNASANLGTTEVIMKALKSGRSHTVIGFCDNLTIAQREEIRQCAEIADCHCLVLTHR